MGINRVDGARRRTRVGAALVAAVVVGLATPAAADNVVTDVNKVTTSEGTPAVVNYTIEQTGPLCEPSDVGPATVTINTPAGVTASPAVLSFTACGVSQAVSFSAAVGTYEIKEATVVGATKITIGKKEYEDEYNNKTSFRLEVTASTAPVNNAPVVSAAAADAVGTEGDTLTTSGAFTDADGDALSLSATGAGDFTDNGDGTWSWSLATDDDAAGTVTVTADDGKGGTATDTFEYGAANADPVLSALSISGDPCAPTLSFSYTDAGAADTHEGTIAWGDGSADAAFTSSPVSVSHTFSGPGTYTIDVTVTDDDGGSDSASISHKVANVPGAILQPINTSGARSAFKLGSTVPVKIQVVDCAGDLVGGLTPQVSLVKIDGTPDGTELEPTSTAAPTSGTTMRYDAVAGQYIYNLGTKGLSSGDWMVKVSDPSFSSAVTAIFSLRR